MEALLPLPAQVGRFVRLPGKDIRFIAIEQVIIEHVDQLFPNFTVAGHGIFRVLRDSEMEVDEEGRVDLSLDLRPTIWGRPNFDPASAEYAPAKTFIKVDLPAPLSPTSAITSPRATSKSASRRACSPPKLLSIPLTTR